MKRTRLRPIRKTPRRGPTRWGREEWEWANQMLHRRSGGRCEKCHEPIRPGQEERHHRMRRRDQGDRLSGILLLHRDCHTWITEHPGEARTYGWIVPALGLAEPDQVPVFIDRAWWLLDDHGNRWTCPPPQ